MRGAFPTAVAVAAAAVATVGARGDAGFEATSAKEYDLRSTYAIALADVTRDGRLDAVAEASPKASAELHVFAQQADGTLVDTLKETLPDNAGSTMATGDFDGDGRLDVVLGGFVVATTPTGLGPPKRVLAGSIVNEVAGHVLGSRRSELVASVDGRGVLLVSSRGGRYATRRIYPTVLQELRLADVDGDGRLDVVGLTTRGLNAKAPDLVVLYGGRGGTFRPWRLNGAFGHGVKTLGVIDITGDGRRDLVAATNDKLGTSVLAGRPHRRFVHVRTQRFDSANVYERADVNCDGLDDLVSMTGNYVSVTLPSTAAGQIGNVVLRAPGIPTLDQSNPDTLAVGDLNGDHRPDVAVANLDGLGVYYLGPASTLAPPDQYFNAVCGTLKLSALAGRPDRPRGGDTLTVTVHVADAAGRALAAGAVSCGLQTNLTNARITVRPLEHSLARGLVRCRWKVPKSATEQLFGALEVSAPAGRAHAAYRFNIPR